MMLENGNLINYHINKWCGHKDIMMLENGNLINDHINKWCDKGYHDAGER